MRPIKIIIAVVLVTTIFTDAIAQSNINDFNDLSAYYGFDEMEIIKLDWDIKNLRVADINGDGRNDIAIINNRKAKIELLVQKDSLGPEEMEVTIDPEDVDVNQLTPFTRFEKQPVAVSQKMYSLVCGDLNSDGMIDLAFYGDPKGLYVILQKTGETGTDKPRTLSWRTRKKIKIDDGLVTANALACADLNNDGTDDLVLAGRDGIYTIIQKKDCSLAEPVKYPTTSQTLGIRIADLNGDNINDLVLITNDRDKPIHLRFGLKTGQLGPQVRFFTEKPWALKLHNIDGITGDEILTVDAVSRRFLCYKFVREPESTLGGADWPILFYPLISGEESSKRDLVVGDLDGDGLADITISEPGSAELVFYKQKTGTGLAEPVRFPAFADIAGLSIADIDGDKKAELGVLSVKEKVIGLSEFKDERLSFPKPVKVIGEPAAMELADVDQSGDIDCVYISRDANDVRSLRVIYNLAEAEQMQAKPVKKTWFSSKKKTSETATVLELKKLTSNPDGLKVLDVDQDDLQDILIFVQYESPILVRQTKKREFEIVDRPTAQASLIKEASLQSIFVSDVDEKAGAELLLAQKNFARSLVFLEGESWSIIDQYNAKSTENKISAVAAFDIEADAGGKPAILLLDGQKGQLQILKAGEDKTYRFEKELDIGRWAAAKHLKMLYAPLTGSNAKSILLFDSEKFALITPPNISNVVQSLEHQFSYETKIKDGLYGHLTAGDINSDSRVDFIMVEYSRDHIEILALDSQNKPIPAMRFRIFEQKGYRSEKRSKARVEPRELQIADVTDDGKNDLVTVIHDRIIIYPQDGFRDSSFILSAR
ncbi:MAG: FG-GAP repeat domain-containing protein [Planctomycetota bacterium]